MFNVRQMEIFWATMRHGSMTNAGRDLGISQPAISRSIRHTEDYIGIKLFERKNGRLQPTAEAEYLFPILDGIFESIESARRTAHDLRDNLSGRISVGALSTLAAELLPVPMGTFLTTRPDVKIGLKIYPSRPIVERILRQQIDIGIVYGPVVSSSLATLDLCTAEVVVALPRGHRLSAQEYIGPEDISEERLITFNPTTPLGIRVEDVFNAAAVGHSPVVECNNTAIACSLVGSGIGVALVTPFVEMGMVSPTIVFKPFRPAIEVRPQVIFDRSLPLSRLTSAFIDEVAAHARGLAV